MVDTMDDQGPYLEHIDSKEIKKLIDLIYSSTPENVIVEPVQVQSDGYQGMIQNIEQMMDTKIKGRQQRSQQ